MLTRQSQCGKKFDTPLLSPYVFVRQQDHIIFHELRQPLCIVLPYIRVSQIAKDCSKTYKAR